MAESKYGRLFTEEDVRQMMRWAFSRGRRTNVPEPVGMIEAFDDRMTVPGAYELTFPVDEPLFLLRGQDKAVPDALVGGQDYEDACADRRASAEHMQGIAAAAAEIEAWQRANPDRVKVPD